jgi:PKD repeat protein
MNKLLLGQPFLQISLILLVICHPLFSQGIDEINASENQGCAPLSVNFSTKASGIISWSWEFSNGTHSTAESPTVLFEKPGQYDVKVSVVYNDSTTKHFEYENYIRVSEFPIVDFSTTQDRLCLGDSVQFANHSLNASTYIWDFGDGTNSNENSPAHHFDNAGNYTITLVATNGTGCTNIKVIENMITVFDIPALDFTAERNDICENDPAVSFRPSSDQASYHWEFGDGTISYEKNPTHTFSVQKKYSVTLRATDANGCASEISKPNYISFHKLQKLDIGISDTVICSNQSIDFLNKTKKTDSIAWSIGNVLISNKDQFEHMFSAAGTYDVKVYHRDSYGCVQTLENKQLIRVAKADKVEIAVSQYEGCAPLTVSFSNNTANAASYHWEIGDSTIRKKSFEMTFTEAGQFPIKAFTEHNSGCSTENTLDSMITVHVSEVSASVSGSAGCQPLSVSFQMSSTDVSDVLWSFGNGATSGQKSPTNIYATPGTFYPEVSFTNKFGCRERLKVADRILVMDTLLAYDAPKPIHICPFEEVRFAGDIGKDSWDWDFGDGTASSDKNPIHQYTTPGKHIVKLHTKNAYGCPVVLETYNEVNVSRISPTDFEYSINHCDDHLVSFTGLGSGNLNYHWNFGDGEKGEGKEASHIFPDEGYYQIQLTLSDEYGCNAIRLKNTLIEYESCSDIDLVVESGGGSITSNPPEIQKNHIPIIEACSVPFEISFEKPKDNAVSWLWDFKDGSTSQDSDPIHTFTYPGTFDVDLYLTNSKGEIDTIETFVRVAIQTQKLNFGYTNNSLCEGTRVQFKASAENVKSWAWDFGDGDTSNISNPEKVYQKSGIYQVGLVMEDKNGCSTRTVYNMSVGNPNIYVSAPVETCSDDTVTIHHNIEGFTGYIWHFGDGNSSNDVYPSHYYGKNGQFSIDLEVTDENNCKKTLSALKDIAISKPVAQFGVKGDSVGCNQLEVQFANLSVGADSWFWDFGNGITSDEKNPTINFDTGNYTISLTAYHGNCSNTIVRQNAIVVHSLQASYSLEQEDICFPVTVQFTDESINSTEWNWNFGDGATSGEKNPYHIYKEKPAGKISLLVRDPFGCSSKIEDEKPVFFDSKFKVSKDKGCVPFTASFDDLTEGATDWFWDFGNGNTSTRQHPEMTYEYEGIYSVSLVTTSPTGCRDTTAIADMLEIGRLESDFSVDFPQSLCSPMIATFSNQSTGADTYQWVFGDGSFSSLEHPIHVYTKVGIFDVNLINSNRLGCRDTVRYENLVKTLGPEAGFHLSDSAMCFPAEFRVTDHSVSAIQWEWFFGDGNISAKQNPRHQYKDPGTYNIVLLATDAYGCKELVHFDSVKVIKTPEASFEVEKQEFCLPDLVALQNKSSNIQNPAYHWSLGNNQSSTEESPEILYNKPGTYQISLEIVNDGVCSDNFTLGTPIYVRDTFHLKQPEVLQLSVTNEQEIEILMDPYTRNNLKYHLVYRKSPDENSFQLIDSIFDPLTSSFLDHNVHTGQTDYSYKIQSHNYCNNPVPLEQLNTYKSIFLSTEILEESIDLTWTHYLGNRFEEYSILRQPDNGEWKDIRRVSAATDQYSDTEDLCPFDYSYMVVARQLDGLNYNSMSNTITARPKYNVFKDQKVDVARTTVIDHDQILTEWASPEIGPDKVLFYEIQKSINGEDYEYIDRVPTGITSYLDSDVLTDENFYHYKISVINTCDVIGQLSNEGTSILLQKKTEEYQNYLFWNPYEGWKEGVEGYLLQEKNEMGQWESIEFLPPDAKSFKIDLSEK